MAFNNADCPCGTSKVYSFSTLDGVENTRCSRCLSMDGYWDEDTKSNPIVPAPSIHDLIQKALGALVVQGGLTEEERMYLAEVSEKISSNFVKTHLEDHPNFEDVNF